MPAFSSSSKIPCIFHRTSGRTAKPFSDSRFGIAQHLLNARSLYHIFTILVAARTVYGRLRSPAPSTQVSNSFSKITGARSTVPVTYGQYTAYSSSFTPLPLTAEIGKYLDALWLKFAVSDALNRVLRVLFQSKSASILLAAITCGRFKSSGLYASSSCIDGTDILQPDRVPLWMPRPLHGPEPWFSRCGAGNHVPDRCPGKLLRSVPGYLP